MSLRTMFCTIGLSIAALSGSAVAQDEIDRMQYQIRSLRNEFMNEFLGRLDKLEQELESMKKNRASGQLVSAPHQQVGHVQPASWNPNQRQGYSQRDSQQHTESGHDAQIAYAVPPRSTQQHSHQALKHGPPRSPHLASCNRCGHSSCTCNSPSCNCSSPCGCQQCCNCQATVDTSCLYATMCGDGIKLRIKGCLPKCVELVPCGPCGHYELTWKIQCCDLKERMFSCIGKNGYYCSKGCPYVCLDICGKKYELPVR